MIRSLGRKLQDYKKREQLHFCDTKTTQKRRPEKKNPETNGVVEHFTEHSTHLYARIQTEKNPRTRKKPSAVIKWKKRPLLRCSMLRWRGRLWSWRIVGYTTTTNTSSTAIATTDRSHIRASSPSPRLQGRNRGRSRSHVPIWRSCRRRSGIRGASAGHRRALRARVERRRRRRRRYHRVVGRLRMRGPGCASACRRRGGRRRRGPGRAVRIYMRRMLSNKVISFYCFPHLRVAYQKL